MKKSILAAFLIATTTLPALAQELPSTEDLEGRLRTTLPGYWNVSDFRLVASTMLGDPISPQALIRFEADIFPFEDLFSPIGERVGPFSVVVQTYNGAQPRTLFGTMQLNYSTGAWSGKSTIENPIGDLGQPRDMFTDPTLVLGSDEQTGLLATLREDTIAAVRARLEGEIATLQAQHDQRIATLKATLDGERAKQEAARAMQAARNADALKLLEEDLKARVADLQARFDPQIDAAQKKLADEIATLKAAHEIARNTLRDEHTAEVEVLNISFAETVGKLKAQQAGIVAELEAGFTAKKERLERQLAEANAILEVQAQTIAAMETAAKNDIRIMELNTQNRARQKEFFQSFGTMISGSLHCKENEGDFVEDTPIFFKIEEVSGTGLSGKVGTGRPNDAFPATLTLASAPGVEPVRLSFSVAFNETLGTYDAELASNGTIRGIAKGKMYFVGNGDGVATCTLFLGAS